jgi:iron complex outermembrane recepter protein
MKTRAFIARPASLALCLVCSQTVMAQNAGMPGALSEVVVNATRFSEPAASLPVGVSVITADDIRASGATTVNQAIMRVLAVPGRQDFYGGGDYNLDLRGFGSAADSNQVIVIDGQRMNEGDLGGTRLAGIAIDDVERIEVLRGSGAVLYGEGATGGVILITTRSGAGKERRNSASVLGSVGSYGVRELRGNATLASGGFSLDVSGQRRDADNHRDNFKSSTDVASASLQWSGDAVRVGLRHSRDSLDTGLPGAISAAQYRADPRQTNTPLDRASIDNQRTTVFGEVVSGGWQLGADAGWRDKKLDSNQSGFPFAYDVKARNQSLRARNEHIFGPLKNIFVVGYDRSSWARENAGFASTAKRQSSAWYVKDDVVLNASGTRLGAGLRTEHIDKQDSNATAPLAERQRAWEFGMSQPLSPQWTAYGRIGTSFRLASVDEFSFTAPSAVLAPQTSRDTEIGARWNHGAGKFEARLYRSNLTNEIGFDPAFPNPLSFTGNGANINFDPTRRQGLEVDATHALGKTFDLRANFGLRQSRFRVGPYSGNDVPLAPKRTLAFRGDWQPSGGHRLSGGVNWVSSQHPDFDNQCRMPSYATADLRYAYTWRQAELSLGVANLTDRKFYTQAFACANGEPTAIYPEAGRAVTVSLRLKF